MNESIVLHGSQQQHWQYLLLCERVRLLYKSLLIAVSGNLLLGVLLVYMQTGIIPAQVLASWFAILFICLLIRLTYYVSFNSKNGDIQQPSLLLKKFRVSVLATGLTWGATGIYLFPSGDMPHQFFVAFVLAGIASAAVTSLAIDKLSAFLFIIPCLLPITINFILEDTREGYLMAIMVIFFTVFIVMSVIRLERDMHESTRLRVISDYQKRELSLQQELNNIIARAQTEFIGQMRDRIAFDNIVNGLLALTQSEHGFFRLVEHSPKGDSYLVAQTIDAIQCDARGNVFQVFEKIFSGCIQNKLPSIHNCFSEDEALGAASKGEAAITSYMVIPILFSGNVVGMLGLANKPDGYQQRDIEFLKPLVIVIGQLVSSARAQFAHEKIQQELARTYDLMERSNAVALIGTWGFDFVSGQLHWSSVTKTIHEVSDDYVCDSATAINFYKEGIHRDTITRVFNAAIREEAVFDEELVIVTAKGQERWVRTIGTSEFKEGVCQQVYGTFQDISERKRIEQVKREFISTVSHELRTPLTSISASLGIMRGGKLGSLPLPLYKLVDIAHSNSLRLTHLINDLLDMDKLAAGKMSFDLQSQTAKQAIGQALQSNKAYADQYQVTFNFVGVEFDSYILVDFQRLQQILANFLSNAIKFSPQGGVVEVALSQRDGWLRIAVKDAGEGIPEEFKAQVFQKFSQADSSDIRQKGGTGLGLAITRELVECMRGRIGFTSTHGAGSIFYCEFPIVDKFNKMQSSV